MIHMIEQSGVADRRDVDERLRAVCDASPKTISTENLKSLVISRNGRRCQHYIRFSICIFTQR